MPGQQSDAVEKQETPEIIATYQGVEIPAAPIFGRKMIAALQEGSYERREVACGLAAIPQGARILELGAGAGVVGAILARNCKPAAILSVEANPQLLPHIARLHQLNGLSGIITLRHGVVISNPAAPMTMTFHVAGNFLGSSLQAREEKKTQAVTVPVLSYDRLRQEFPHDAIMMDIEGGELDFFRHADLSGVNVIVLEMHRDIYGREGMRECRALIEAGGLEMDGHLSKAGVHVYRRR